VTTHLWHPKLGRGGRPLRIAYGRIFHEANAFSPLLTTREDFERMHYLEGDALARATTLAASEITGYPVIATTSDQNPTGTGGNVVITVYYVVLSGVAP